MHRTIFSYSPSSAYRIAENRSLYLDTSVIRRLGKKLVGWPNAASSYTSILTIVELLNGITKTDKDFRERRSAIVGLLAAEIAIDWQMPQFRLRSAFPQLREKYDIYEERNECIEELLCCLAQCQTRDEFARQEATLLLEYDLNYFATADEAISRTHIDAARKWVPFIRSHFDDPSTIDRRGMVGLPPTASIAQTAERIGASDFEFGMALFAITKVFAVEETYTEELHDDLFESYDGSIDLFIRACCLQQWREIGRYEMPGRNTGLDLEHLLYVSHGSRVVTADIGMSNAVVQAGGGVVREKDSSLGAASSFY
jgi:hypothetical protein